MPPVRCTIVVPVYGRPALTRQCLDVLLAGTEESSFEIVVVDDGSPDGSGALWAGYHDRVTLVANEQNLGFARACNAGAAVAEGEYLVFLNNDTVPHPGWLDALAGYADAHPEAGAVGARLVFPDGTIQHAGLVFGEDRFPRHAYAGFPADHPAVTRSRRFAAVTGACVLVRPAAFAASGGFDPHFHNGYEDVDLCLRLGELGWESHLCAESVVTHLESATRTGERYEELNRLFLERWGERVVVDDLRLYQGDGLLRFRYEERAPHHLSLASALATVAGNDVEPLDRLLSLRGRQATALLRETARLEVAALERLERPGAAQRPSPFLARRLGAANGGLTPERLIQHGRWHSLTTGTRPLPELSLIVPVKNRADDLRCLLAGVLEQRCSADLEIVAVDSGSTDGAIAVLRDHGATIVQIEPSAFSHGGTRNLAARYASGSVLVFVSTRTLPADDRWLESLVLPLVEDADVAGVTSRVLPRSDADLLVRKDVLRGLSGSNERIVRLIDDRAAYDALSEHELRTLINFHTVSAAVRASVLREHPFPDVRKIGEDLAWAKTVLEAGWKLVHEPASRARHSHDYGPLDTLRVNADDGIANRAVVGRCLDGAQLVEIVEWLIRDDWAYLRGECALSGAELDRWRLESVLRRSAQIAGQWVGVNHEHLTAELARSLSRFEETRAGAVAN